VNSDGAVVGLDARLANIGLFTDALSGPVTLAADATRGPSDSAPWRLSANVGSQAGITATLAGSLIPAEGTVDMTATGQLPLALANRALAPRSVSGTLGFDLALRGRPSLAAVSGQIRTSGARVTLPILQTALENLQASGQLSGGRLSFDAGGDLGSGGRITTRGTLDITSPGLPAQIAVTGQALRLVDPTLYNALIDRADISITGALAGSLQVAGDIALGETELRVPETGLGGSTAIPPITHLGESAAERRTRLAAGLGPRESAGSGGSQRIGLDLTIAAPGRVFIRGRGLDAEMGGTLRIGGTTANVIPAGRFDLIRGRLSILGTRLDLTDGSATLQGNFDPFIRLLATSRSGGYTIGINLIGPISAPEISFTSTPALPEDEVLAQLLFGRSVSALSPVQLLQMADAAAALAGGSSRSGIFASLRENLGLDDLDLQTDEEGNAALRAGRYLSDNVYTDVTLGGSGNTGVSLNIDLSPSVTARGSFNSDGTSSLGVFFERDY
jgi:translocation and assembly module TamB